MAVQQDGYEEVEDKQEQPSTMQLKMIPYVTHCVVSRTCTVLVLCVGGCVGGSRDS